MGCLNLPTSLRAWAQYCDCLEPTKQFDHDQRDYSQSKDPSESNSQSIENESQMTQQKQKRSKYQVKWDQTVKVNQDKKSMLKKNLKVVNNWSKRDTIDQLSDIIPQNKPQQSNIFDASHFDDQQSFKQTAIPKLYDPLALKMHQKRARVTAPLIQRYLKAQKDNQDEQLQFPDVPTISNNKTFFMNKEEQAEYKNSY